MHKISSSHASFFQNETYRCSCSNNDLSKQKAISKGWFCFECNEYIRIYAEDNGEKAVFVRAQARDIVENDLVCPDSMSINTFYKVLGVNNLTSKRYNGKLGIGLESYRQIIVEPDYIINCRIGGSW